MVNKVILVGRLGVKPELKKTSNKLSVTNFTLATTEKWQKDGVKQEKTEWHQIVAFGKTAELAAQYLDKGRQVYVEGSLATREWEDKSGNKRYTTEIKANNLVFLGDRGETGEAAKSNQSHPNFKPNFDEDVPF